MSTAYARALSPDTKRLMERAVAANTDDEVLYLQLSAADRAMSTQLFHVLVMCCESGALNTLERAGDTEGAIGCRWLMEEHEPDTAGRHASLLLQILSYAFTDNTRGSLDALDLLVEK